jgi:hypothetical protein
VNKHFSESLHTAAVDTVMITAFGNVDDERDRYERCVLYIQSLISPFLLLIPADDISRQWRDYVVVNSDLVRIGESGVVLIGLLVQLCSNDCSSIPEIWSVPGRTFMSMEGRLKCFRHQNSRLPRSVVLFVYINKGDGQRNRQPKASDM